MTISYDPIQDIVVSRQHALIKIQSKDLPKFTISDLKSANGTFLNGRRLTQESELQPGDTVELGLGGPKFSFSLDPQFDKQWRGAEALRRSAPTALQMYGRANAIAPPAPSLMIGNDRGMKIAALIFSVLGTLSALIVAVSTYAVASLFGVVSGSGYGAVWRFLSVVIPVACILGTGILWTAPMYGGAILLGCAVVILLIAGFNFLSMTTILLLAAGGGFALVSAAVDAGPAGLRRQRR